MTTHFDYYMLAIDPGGVHCGMALFRPASAPPGWECFGAYEKPPEEAVDDLARLLLDNALETVVYERFRLYPDIAPSLAYSEMETSQQIGAIKYVVRLSQRHASRPAHERAIPDDMTRQVELVGQVAEIQTPTESLLRANKIKSTAKRFGAGGHAKSAELHGWCYLIRHGRCGIKVVGNSWPEGCD